MSDKKNNKRAVLVYNWKDFLKNSYDKHDADDKAFDS